MNERLYYTDAYTTKFKAKAVEWVRHNDHLAVVLDKTYFYPTSGGQPFDRGYINDRAVINVSIRKQDGAVLHWLEGELWSEDVTAEIDWERRFDHMQQHTGQHILSQAFIQTANAKTVSFHLSDDSVTIDLNTTELTPEQIAQAEFLANQIIWQNRLVRVRMVSPEEAAKLSIRKAPAVENGPLRLIDIRRFDLTACGGTHVARTGEVGLLKIIRLERRGEKLRLEFACGKRALLDYRLKNSIVNNLAADLTTGHGEIVAAVNRLQEELKQARRTLKKQEGDLLSMEVDQLLQKGMHKSGVTIVTQVFMHREPAQLRTLANLLTKRGKVVALLGMGGYKSQLLFSRSADAPGDMDQLIKPALQVLGPAAGGGNATYAQGGGPSADEERVQQALSRAERLLKGQIR